MGHYIQPPFKKLHLEVMVITVLRNDFDGIYLWILARRPYPYHPTRLSHDQDVISIYVDLFSHMGCVIILHITCFECNWFDFINVHQIHFIPKYLIYWHTLQLFYISWSTWLPCLPYYISLGQKISYYDSFINSLPHLLFSNKHHLPKKQL